ncbi:MAG TPA: fatty acid desaturase [Paracoccaceae bacterium]|nr:fatty acid desaturase [Paracoccaceae bacterium]
MLGGARRAGFGRLKIEWPTWVALIGCYSLWGVALASHAALGWWFAVPGALAVAFHSSLQHEVLHGHPTRSSAINEALVFLPLGLAIPYRRFRDLHLRHHNDERLTDPYDDPESYYLAEGDWTLAGGRMRWLRRFNATFAGRMLIGPALAMWGFWRAEAGLILAGDARVRGAWARHALGAAPVVALVWAAGMDLWLYVLLAAYPGMSLIMVRSFIEHRAAEHAAERSVIVDAHWFWRLLFLNNNFHWVHHRYPAVAWYLIPERWQAERDDVLARNGSYYLPGYAAVAWRWLFRSREPVIHPFVRRGGGALDGGGPSGPQQPTA